MPFVILSHFFAILSYELVENHSLHGTWMLGGSFSRSLTPAAAATSRKIAALTLSMLRRIAAANHLAQRRVFSARDVDAALAAAPAALPHADRLGQR